MTGAVKICGVNNSDVALTAARAGADFIGLVFIRQSPRFVSIDNAENIMTELKNASFEEGFDLPRIVGLFVDANDGQLSEAAHLLTHFQFHGHESPGRLDTISGEFGVSLIKALNLGEPSDLTRATEFEEACDYLLFDARPPKGAALPGGNGVAFDWSILETYQGDADWLLAGGLTPINVEEAVRQVNGVKGFAGVDVSSGVETAPGAKDPDQIKGFINNARKAMD